MLSSSSGRGAQRTKKPHPNGRKTGRKESCELKAEGKGVGRLRVNYTELLDICTACEGKRVK
jgi:hypothetical protein